MGCVFSKTCCLFYQATQVKYITYICQRLAFVWRAHIVVEIAYDNEDFKMNEQFINVSREVVGERGVSHRWGSVGTHKSHFLPQIVVSMTMLSTGVSSRSGRCRVGRSARTFTIIPPPWADRSFLNDLKPGTSN